MSVVMHLYRPIQNISYGGYYMDDLFESEMVPDESTGVYKCIEDLEKKLGCPCTFEENPELYNKWANEQERNAWSDSIIHEKIDLNYLEAMFDGWIRKERMMKKLHKFHIQEFLAPRTNTIYRYIPVEEVLYAQGWFFKKSFFNKDLSWFIGVSYDEMKNFFHMYIDYHDKKRYSNLQETIQKFLSTWEDGMIFECAF